MSTVDVVTQKHKITFELDIPRSPARAPSPDAGVGARLLRMIRLFVRASSQLLLQFRI